MEFYWLLNSYVDCGQVHSLPADTLYQESLDARKPPGSGYTSKVRVRDRYHIVGFISSGTYGRVYKAIGKNGQKGEFAIKKLASHSRHIDFIT